LSEPSGAAAAAAAAAATAAAAAAPSGDGPGLSRAGARGARGLAMTQGGSGGLPAGGVGAAPRFRAGLILSSFASALLDGRGEPRARARD